MNRAYRFLHWLLQHPWHVIALAMAFALPGLGSGYAMDDFWLLAQTSAGGASVSTPAWDLYRIWPLAAGDGTMIEQPWYAAPHNAVHFFRPLTSLALSFDFAVAQRAAWWPQVVNLAWWLALLAALWSTLQRVMPSRTIAALALLIYAFDDAHAMTIAWVCGRHLLMAPTLFCLAWCADLRARDEGWRYGRFCCIGLWLLSLLASESALVLLPLVMVETWRHEKISEMSLQRLLRTLVACRHWLLPAVLWLGVYVMMGYGAKQGDIYICIWHDPCRFFELAWLRISALMASAWLFFPADPMILFEADALTAMAVGTVLMLSIGGVGYALWTRTTRYADRSVVEWSLATLLGVPVLIGGAVQDRTLSVLGISTALALASLLSHPLGLREAAWGRRLVARDFFCSALIVLHMIVSPLLLPVRTFGHRFFAAVQNSPALSLAQALGDDRDQRGVVFITSPGPLRAGANLAMLRGMGLATPPWSITLSSGHGETMVQRNAAQTLCLRCEEGFAHTLEDRAVRVDTHRFAAGERFFTRDVEIVIVSIDKNGYPTQICATWPNEAQMLAAAALVWSDNGYRRVSWPGVGESITFSATSPIPHPVMVDEAP